MIGALVTILVSIIVYCLYMILRVELTYEYRIFWLDASLKYELACIRAGKIPEISIDDIRDFDDFLKDLTCFKRDSMIADKEKLQIMKDFMERGRLNHDH